MKKLFSILTTVCLLAVLSAPTFAGGRTRVTDSEMATYHKLKQQGIINGTYTQRKLNHKMSKIDVMSALNSTIDHVNADKATMDDVGNVYRNMVNQDRFYNNLVNEKIDSQEELMKELKENQERNGGLLVLTFLFAALGIIF